MGFLSGFRERVAHLLDLHREGILGKWIGGIWLVLGAVSFVKTEWLSAAQQEKWQLIPLMPSISLAWWIAGAALILFAWAVEASFQHARRERTKVERFEEDAKPKLEISDPIESVEPKGTI